MGTKYMLLQEKEILKNKSKNLKNVHMLSKVYGSILGLEGGRQWHILRYVSLRIIGNIH